MMDSNEYPVQVGLRVLKKMGGLPHIINCSEEKPICSREIKIRFYSRLSQLIFRFLKLFFPTSS
jgi:hypothetical protein